MGFVGLVLLVVGFVEWGVARERSRDPLIVGACLVLTAFVMVLFGQVGDELFSDAASSVSGAPGP